ncbi:MAG: hypothetical protein LH467_00790 [Gemmatimonadaceae bacterium]|nr:hypothetical protein [Gemmatimonadaceae bacterium]
MSIVTNEHLARIRWSDEQVRRGLPAFTRTTDPAWFESPDEGWSLVCRFHASPREQGSPSVAQVAFLTENAPHHLLKPGAQLYLFERSTRQLAMVEIIE